MPTTSYNQYIHKNGDWRLIGVGEIDPISIEHGGTGASTLAGAKAALEIPEKATWYGTSNTTASTAAKVVTCANYTLEAGAVIGVLFTTASTAATPTLNVNSTGAKSIYIGNSTPNATTNVLKWSANTMIYFIYDGTNYRYITSVSAGDVIPSRGANTWYGVSTTTASTQAKTSTIDNFVLTKGAVVYITFSAANTYTSAKITLNINSTGAKDIYYNSAVTSTSNTLLWSAGETLVFVYNGSYYYFVGKTKITETDPVFSASAAAGISSSDITNWNGTSTPTANSVVKYDTNSYLYSTTPPSSDNSTKVATTAYVDAATSGAGTKVQIVRW